jgi:hypothetical protein
MSGLVLVVDDNPSLGRVLALGLKRAGYGVVTCLTGSSALDLLRDDPTIVLLLSDVVMPGGMNGIELARASRQIRPGLPVLLVTGFADDVFEQFGASATEFPLIGKPFAIAELVARLKELLAG